MALKELADFACRQIHLVHGYSIKERQRQSFVCPAIRARILIMLQGEILQTGLAVQRNGLDNLNLG